jgi:hypothetical protein
MPVLRPLSKTIQKSVKGHLPECPSGSGNRIDALAAVEVAAAPNLSCLCTNVEPSLLGCFGSGLSKGLWGSGRAAKAGAAEQAPL